jgi:hypothetical protein
MIRITQQESAAGAKRYYATADYYSEGQELVGSWGGVLWEGVVTGIVGAAVVAIWFFAIDAIRGEPLRTPKLLGIALLRQPDPGSAILAYTLLHGLAFIVFGILGAFLVAAAERQPVILFALIIVFTAFEISFFGAVVILASWILDYVAGWTIFLGNLHDIPIANGSRTVDRWFGDVGTSTFCAAGVNSGSCA